MAELKIQKESAQLLNPWTLKSVCTSIINCRHSFHDSRLKLEQIPLFMKYEYLSIELGGCRAENISRSPIRSFKKWQTFPLDTPGLARLNKIW